MTKKRKFNAAAAATQLCVNIGHGSGWCASLYDGKEIQQVILEEGKKKSRKGRRKEKWPPSITLRKKEDGLLPPLQVGSKMECAGLKGWPKEGPLYTKWWWWWSPLSLSHSLEFFRVRPSFFAALRDFERRREPFPSFFLLLFGALRDDYTAGFFFFFLPMITTSQKPNVNHWFARVCTSLGKDTKKQTQIIQKVGHLFTIFSYSTRPKMVSPYLNSQCQSLGGEKVGVGENFDRCAPICLHTCFCVISSLAFSITFVKIYKRYIMFTSFFFQHTFYSTRNHFVVHIKNKFLLLLTKVPALKKYLNVDSI